MRLKLILGVKSAAMLFLLFIAWVSWVLIASMDKYYEALRNPRSYPPPLSFPFWADFVINYIVLMILWTFGLGAIYLLMKPIRPRSAHASLPLHQ